jgi:hypothetical protein
MEINKQIVRQVFRDHYHDAKIYRWAERNKRVLKWAFGIPAIPVCAFASFDYFTPLMIWSGSFILIIWAAGLDHFYIGTRLRKILNVLERDHQITIGLYHLLEICKNEIPE